MSEAIQDYNNWMPKTIGERVDKIQHVHSHANIQNMNTFQVNRFGNMVKRYGGNLRTYTNVSNAISQTFYVVTTGIYEGKKGTDPL